MDINYLKKRKAILEKEYENAWLNVVDAENKLSKKEEAIIRVEKQIRSLAAKNGWVKIKNKQHEKYTF